ncbi:D-alanyl-D-alanine carboxypeptidase [Lutibacter oricola]|uniref:D-alanyl-D-alanine carboxypeptidase n=1 Tax=Lutibacter oricola TaxID=762486 RepID=A0A1H2SPV1_9FLAO|nr:serine hydrolase domain-containing protein [Lutibacter oricola]SDW33495.1 D-alanyl-D-alanine carboxypeptidase [Lutibacter oricola]
MKKVLFIATFIVSCSLIGQETIENKFQQVFNKELSKENVHNAFLKVYSGKNKIDVEFFGGDSITENTPFYLASIAKTFTAVSVAILKENGQISFNDRISKYLSKDIIKNLHIIDDVDYSNEITIAHLLQHTSGLSDYFSDKTMDGTPRLIDQLLLNPSKIYNPIELIQFYKDKMKPIFPPGKGYHYTDTEYVLLGLIIEKVSGLELHKFYKEHIFKPLKMNNTFLNLRSKPISETKKMANFYASAYEVSSFNSLSADWAGGGLVSTNSDLLKFQKALFEGEIISKNTLKEVQQWIPETLGMEYGFGLRKINLNELSTGWPNLEIIGHSGSTGSFMFYCPKLNTYISGTLNQMEESRNTIALITEILTIIQSQL